MLRGDVNERRKLYRVNVLLYIVNLLCISFIF